MKWLIVLMLIVLPGSAHAASVTLSWVPPAINCDGSFLDDLEGSIIMWGDTSGGPYPSSITINGPFITSASIDVGAVSDTTLYFVIASFNSYGKRSDGPGGCGYSNQISRPFPAVLPSPPVLQSVVVD